MNSNNVLMIQNMNYVGMREKIGVSNNVQFESKSEINEYFKKQNMMNFLGLDKTNFPCLFHNDDKYSASVQIGSDGKWWYQCGDENCKVKKLNMIHLTDRLIGLKNKNTMYGTIKFLSLVYRVSLIDEDWIKEYSEIIDENISTLLEIPDMKEMYPNLYNVIKNYLNILILMNVVAKKYIRGKDRVDSDGNAIFTYDVRKIIEDITNIEGKRPDSKRTSQKISLFTFLGLLNKLSDEKIKDGILDNLNRHKRENNYRNRTQVYSIPPYTSEQLSIAEEWATSFINKNMSMKFFSWYTVYKNFGKEDATRTYPQEADREVNDDSFETEMVKFIMNEIELHDFIRVNDVVEHMKIWNKENAICIVEQTGKTQKITKVKVDLRVSQIINDVLCGYGLKVARLNKEYKNKFNMPDSKEQSRIIIIIDE